MDEYIQKHLMRHYKAQPQDVYKLLYQATHGVGHILDASALSKLEKEIDGLTGKGWELWSEISPILSRVDLRAFAYRELNTDLLYEVMLESHIDPQPDALKQHWEQFIQTTDMDYAAFDHAIKRNNYPAVHHSKEFKAAYKPAYRVVKTDVFKEKFLLEAHL